MTQVISYNIISERVVEIGERMWVKICHETGTKLINDLKVGSKGTLTIVIILFRHSL